MTEHPLKTISEIKNSDFLGNSYLVLFASADPLRHAWLSHVRSWMNSWIIPNRQNMSFNAFSHENNKSKPIYYKIIHWNTFYIWYLQIHLQIVSRNSTTMPANIFEIYIYAVLASDVLNILEMNEYFTTTEFSITVCHYIDSACINQ